MGGTNIFDFRGTSAGTIYVVLTLLIELQQINPLILFCILEYRYSYAQCIKPSSSRHRRRDDRVDGALCKECLRCATHTAYLSPLLITSGYGRSLSRQCCVYVVVSRRRREGRGDEEVEGRPCAPCVHSWGAGRAAVWCEEGGRRRRRRKRKNSPLLRCFSFSSFWVCLYSLKYTTTLHFHNFLLLLWWWLWWLHVPEHLPVDHIGCGECGKWLAMQRRVGDHYRDLGRIADSRKRDVQLTVGKYRGRQVDCDL